MKASRIKGLNQSLSEKDDIPVIINIIGATYLSYIYETQ